MGIKKPTKANWQVLHQSLKDICMELEDREFEPDIHCQEAIFNLLRTNCNNIYAKEILGKTTVK